MISDESIQIMSASYEVLNNRDDWSRIISTFARAFEHRWINERIVHPLPIEKSRACRQILNASYRFMAWHYHHVVLAGELERCPSCVYDYSGHRGWHKPFGKI